MTSATRAYLRWAARLAVLISIICYLTEGR